MLFWLGDNEMEEVIKYYVYKNDVRFIEDGFEDIDEAIEYARENNCDEVEEASWDSRKSYNNYEPADRFKTVWEND